MSAREMKRKARAFVLLSVELGKEEEVMEKLLKIGEVKEVHIITGEKDLIVVLETERELVVPSSKKITDLISRRIASINGVQDTETIIPTISKTKWPEQI